MVHHNNRYGEDAGMGMNGMLVLAKKEIPKEKLAEAFAAARLGPHFGTYGPCNDELMCYAVDMGKSEPESIGRELSSRAHTQICVLAYSDLVGMEQYWCYDGGRFISSYINSDRPDDGVQGASVRPDRVDKPGDRSFADLELQPADVVDFMERWPDEVDDVAGAVKEYVVLYERKWWEFWK